MYCLFCRQKIKLGEGYVSYFLHGQRFDYHIPHKPKEIPHVEEQAQSTTNRL